jgi:DNA-binding GntR family transcriptional regulator
MITEDDVPKYEQLADILRRMIVSGELAPRTPIPSKRQLQGEFGVAGGTIDRAVAVLKAEGRLRTVLGKGIYVRPRNEWTD